MRVPSTARARWAAGLLSLSSIALLASLVRASAPADSTVAASADRYLRSRVEAGAFSGAVLIAREGRIVLRKGYGYSDLEQRIPYTPETRHEVASVSKMFTAMAALLLEQRGKLRLDDPICRYLDDCPPAWRAITVEQLLHHTSGIPDYEERLQIGSERYLAFMARPTASAEIFDAARKDTLDFVPGSQFHYSNTGYNVLARVIERAAGRPFARFVEDELLKPAGMSHSGVLGVRETKDLAYGYTTPRGKPDWDKILWAATLTDGHLQRVPNLALTPPIGDAWLYSTVDDLYRWSLTMDGGSLVSPALAAKAWTPSLEGYAAGWFVGQAFGTQRVRHNGFLPGYVTDFVKFPEAKVTIVVFCNYDNARMSNIARDLSAMAFGESWDMPVRGKVARLEDSALASLEGDYRMADSSIVMVRNKPENLTAEIKGRYTAGLIPLSATEFYMPLSEGRVTFTRGAGGRGQRINLRYGGQDHVAERIAAP